MALTVKSDIAVSYLPGGHNVAWRLFATAEMRTRRWLRWHLRPRTCIRFYAAPFGATEGGLQLLFFHVCSRTSQHLERLWGVKPVALLFSMSWSACFLSSEFSVERECRTRLLARAAFGNKSLWSLDRSFLQNRTALRFTQATNVRWTPHSSSCRCS